MKGLVQGGHDMANSPTWERDAATITSPWRMGMWFLILNSLIVIGLVSVYGIVSSTHNPSSAVLANMGMGRLFSGAIFLALTFFFSVFVPIRVFGVFVGPRTGRYFDQIVLSGITLWRFLAGKIRGV
ncbi:MAG: hypothetical protein ACI957_005539 [Verrucomicrobiales bacterium]|jgi:hypothetical protein